jgi:hypothetical protein
METTFEDVGAGPVLTVPPGAGADLRADGGRGRHVRRDGGARGEHDGRIGVGGRTARVRRCAGAVLGRARRRGGQRARPQFRQQGAAIPLARAVGGGRRAAGARHGRRRGASRAPRGGASQRRRRRCATVTAGRCSRATPTATSSCWTHARSPHDLASSEALTLNEATATAVRLRRVRVGLHVGRRRGQLPGGARRRHRRTDRPAQTADVRHPDARVRRRRAATTRRWPPPRARRSPRSRWTPRARSCSRSGMARRGGSCTTTTARSRRTEARPAARKR